MRSSCANYHWRFVPGGACRHEEAARRAAGGSVRAEPAFPAAASAARDQHRRALGSKPRDSSSRAAPTCALPAPGSRERLARRRPPASGVLVLARELEVKAEHEAGVPWPYPPRRHLSPKLRPVVAPPPLEPGFSSSDSVSRLSNGLFASRAPSERSASDASGVGCPRVMPRLPPWRRNRSFEIAGAVSLLAHGDAESTTRLHVAHEHATRLPARSAATRCQLSSRLPRTRADPEPRHPNRFRDRG